MTLEKVKIKLNDLFKDPGMILRLEQVATRNHYEMSELLSNLAVAVDRLKTVPSQSLLSYFFGMAQKIASGVWKKPSREVELTHTYEPDLSEPLFLLDGLPTVAQAAIKVDSPFPFEQMFLNQHVERVLQNLPEDIPPGELLGILTDISFARLQNIYWDPYNLIQALHVRPIWDDVRGDWESLYKSLSDYIRENPQHSKKSIENSYKKIRAEAARWIQQEYDRRNPDGITRHGKPQPRGHSNEKPFGKWHS